MSLLDANASGRDRMSMQGGNRLKLGLFGANCSSGRAVTKVPERWSGTWPDNLRLARMADAAGIDFLLPIGRWKGYGGETDYQGATLETITWATALLAATRRITCFGTVHAPLFHPIIAAKEMVTADQIGEAAWPTSSSAGTRTSSRCWRRAARSRSTLRHAQEWIDAIKRIWSEREDFDSPPLHQFWGRAKLQLRRQAYHHECRRSPTARPAVK